MSFSATDACFEGFRVTRGRPGAVLLWTLIGLAGLIAVACAALPILMPHLKEIEAAKGNIQSLSEDARQAMNLAGYATTPIIAAVQAILAPAVYRAVLRPEQRGFGSVRIGADEARVFVVVLGLSLVSALVQFGGEMLEQVVLAQAGVVVAMAAGMAVFIFTVWFSVRCSLIAPATFAERRIRVGAPFALAGRHFWPLLGMLIISLVMAALVVLLLLVVGWPLYAIIVQAGTEPTAMAGVAAIGMILLLPLAATLTCTIVWAPFAAAYRDLRGDA